MEQLSGFHRDHTYEAADGEMSHRIEEVVDGAFEQEERERKESELTEEQRKQGLRKAPSWEIGPQYYGDPSLWRPDIDTPLTDDKEYRRLHKIIRGIR